MISKLYMTGKLLCGGIFWNHSFCARMFLVFPTKIAKIQINNISKGNMILLYRKTRFLIFIRRYLRPIMPRASLISWNIWCIKSINVRIIKIINKAVLLINVSIFNDCLFIYLPDIFFIHLHTYPWNNINSNNNR